MSVDGRALRIAVYEMILDLGRVPTAEALAGMLGLAAGEVRSALASLDVGKTVLVHPSTGEIWMAGPFSAVETPYRVVSGARMWWANCAWDMFGIVMLVNDRAEIQARCADCGDPMILEADPSVPPNDDAVVHFLVPARRWYDDIGFT